MAWRKEKEAMEQDERMTLHRLQEEELRVRQQQWEWEKSRDIRGPKNRKLLLHKPSFLETPSKT